MRIVGEWLLCDDGIVRPSVRAYVQGSDGQAYADDFLIDSGADRTAFSSELLRASLLPQHYPSPSVALMGVGGTTTFVLVTTAIELTRGDGGPAIIRGTFAAFTDPRATDLSILGRDVLDNFDLILSRRRDEVLLLAPNHHYSVTHVR